MAVLVPDTPELKQMPDTPSLPTSTLPAQIRGLNMSGRFPMDMRAPPVDLRFCLSWALSDAETYYGDPPYMPDIHEQEGMHLRTYVACHTEQQRSTPGRDRIDDLQRVRLTS